MTSFLIGTGVLATFSVADAWGAEDGSTMLAPALVGPRIFYLDDRGRLLTAKPDGSDLRVLLRSGLSGPDGVAVDVQAKQIYWTNMGKVKEDDGSIQRLDLDGTNLTTIVPLRAPFGKDPAPQVQLPGYWRSRALGTAATNHVLERTRPSVGSAR